MPEIKNKIGAIANVAAGTIIKYPPDLEFMAKIPVRVDDARTVNPEPENILDEISQVLQRYSPSLVGMKGNQRNPLTKTDILSYVASFTDYGFADVNPKFKDLAYVSATIIHTIEETFSTNQNPLGVGEQLEIALKASGNRLEDAVLGLTVATRHMARLSDKKLMPDGFEVDTARAVKWKRTIKPFGYGNFEDVSGDTYHFWEGVMAGMSAGEYQDNVPVRELKGASAKMIYRNTALITNILRYKIGGNGGDTHEYADTLGFNVGLAIARPELLSQLLHV